ncbi:MAG: aspartate carbamoyltransferase catalytic subunit [Planctomycetes bacterium]|nr:aspartate carbamoyltransferase catalytic subunit [Planctomycetota bacterium]
MPAPRHLVSIDDLSLAEMEAIFETAKRYSEDTRAWADVARGSIAATLFYEPSTRTRLSFESAMLRLGGGVITAADMSRSSASKGESLADTIRVVSGYADAIILRHQSEGAARLAAEYADIPVINAGDGSHEHPTQTLCDLYSLWIERGRIEGLDVVFAGDLRYSRTIHSFAYALARFRANIVCVPQPGFELPAYVVQRLREEFGVEPVRAEAGRLGELASKSDVLYLTPQKPHQLSLFTDPKGLSVDHVDAVYMTRPQTERFKQEAQLDETQYLQLGQRQMAAESLRDAVVMHPLPRREEINADMDGDPRSIYFKQAARGVPIRMAILASLLGETDCLKGEPVAQSPAWDAQREGLVCPNENCISHTEARHVSSKYRLASRLPLRATCAYCSQAIPFGAVGCSTSRLYHLPDSRDLRKIRPDHLVFFRDAAHAEATGYQAAANVGSAG